MYVLAIQSIKIKELKGSKADSRKMERKSNLTEQSSNLFTFIDYLAFEETKVIHNIKHHHNVKNVLSLKAFQAKGFEFKTLKLSLLEEIIVYFSSQQRLISYPKSTRIHWV
ncbi:hypothetical protein L6164_031312 [Bauhinia variegata]|uniref:Uncharacterized protein n=1 Tax=Bauhinia variegata TaxID=167791 RepID=A0ACB9LF30_BAUVA|nr:hypothetical protein L6164_031312 [Bauhinia variegata]